MSALDWLGLALVCAAGAVSPGPSLALVLRHATESLAAGVRCALSHALGVSVYAALAVSGLALVFLRQPAVLDLIGALGALWLCWLAWQLWRAPAQWQPGAGRLAHGPAVDGLLMALINPKVALVFLAIFVQFLPAEASLGERLGMVALPGLIDGGWYVLASGLVQRGGLLQFLRRRAGLVNRLTAAVFLAVALGLLAGLLRTA